ncbi:HK97-gp10 family putative phage morphogenesis protein [Aurantimonas endophytica]|uniref:HK97 gp10 family phage protein n=1 Tax=Aurantimonas endophytica TaxID=1522175 RepID=A0A7W6HAN4_9HYPH|nr:HK97-gp10 family putative phage morphogenesis protein [Aurantimonas endophytica]MBB4001591.1 HK97 gp10 family phage protein [Aurantimonas endophytica]MCO6402769.1 HK97 gp10 family phage protein [Aurantimonas endophytica]
MAATVKVEGLKELEIALEQLPRSTGKAALRRVLRKAAQPVADAATAKAPRDEGNLQASIGVGTKLTRRQRGVHKKMFKDDKASVEIFVGAGGLPQAITQEFGTVDHGPQAFLRPSWDAHKDGVLDSIKADLWAEIEKAAKRHARKTARLAAKG